MLATAGEPDQACLGRSLPFATYPAHSGRNRTLACALGILIRFKGDSVFVAAFLIFAIANSLQVYGNRKSGAGKMQRMKLELDSRRLSRSSARMHFANLTFENPSLKSGWIEDLRRYDIALPVELSGQRGEKTDAHFGGLQNGKLVGEEQGDQEENGRPHAGKEL